MRWANFLLKFNFNIAHIAGKHNLVADALSRRPKVNAVTIATHNDLSSMIDEYATDPDFKDVISALALGKSKNHSPCRMVIFSMAIGCVLLALYERR